MLDFLFRPWPWYVGGPLIGLTVPLLLLLGNKSFGISSSLRHVCAICLPANIPFFQYNWRKEIWNLCFAAGIILGAFVTSHFLSVHEPVAISAATTADLQSMGIQDFSGLLPGDLFDPSHAFSPSGLLILLLGGFLVGFGTRYAGGCTSGHAIMGLSTLQWPSLIATICFMIGGFFSAWLLVPALLKLL